MGFLYLYLYLYIYIHITLTCYLTFFLTYILIFVFWHSIFSGMRPGTLPDAYFDIYLACFRAQSHTESGDCDMGHPKLAAWLGSAHDHSPRRRRRSRRCGGGGEEKGGGVAPALKFSDAHLAGGKKRKRKEMKEKTGMGRRDSSSCLLLFIPCGRGDWHSELTLHRTASRVYGFTSARILVSRSLATCRNYMQ